MCTILGFLFVIAVVIVGLKIQWELTKGLYRQDRIGGVALFLFFAGFDYAVALPFLSPWH